MGRAVYFRHKENFSEIAVTTDGELDRYYRLQDGFLTGSIFVGKITRIKKNQGIFIDIGLEKDGLLSYEDGRKIGEFILVQVKKEPTEKKGCALTKNITLAGKFAVLNDKGETKFSHKLSEEKKNFLSETIKREQKNDFYDGKIGFVFRTACEEADLNEIEDDCRILLNKYEKIISSAKNNYSITKLYAETAIDIAERLLSKGETISEDFEKVEKQVESLEKRTVEKEGVELVFDKTEAMTVVDVNSHRFNASYASTDATAFQANCIAVKELARQIRLRNIGGIIMVDFISFKNKDYLLKLKEELAKELLKDNVKTSVELVESVGLFAIVRKIRYASL